MRTSILLTTLFASLIVCCVGYAPSTFVKRRSAGWKTIELNDSFMGQYEAAWQKTVDTIARDHDIKMLDKGSGYSTLYSAKNNDSGRGHIILF